jgi:hypothetical protein
MGNSHSTAATPETMGNSHSTAATKSLFQGVSQDREFDEVTYFRYRRVCRTEDDEGLEDTIIDNNCL